VIGKNNGSIDPIVIEDSPSSLMRKKSCHQEQIRCIKQDVLYQIKLITKTHPKININHGLTLSCWFCDQFFVCLLIVAADCIRFAIFYFVGKYPILISCIMRVVKINEEEYANIHFPGRCLDYLGGLRRVYLESE
jgi:hypothetical protein